jgi:hypothetical protein
MNMKISGGGLGSALDMTAGADIVAVDAARTRLDWSGEAVMRGPVAAVGGRVLDAQAQKLIAQTFANVPREAVQLVVQSSGVGVRSRPRYRGHHPLQGAVA